MIHLRPNRSINGPARSEATSPTNEFKVNRLAANVSGASSLSLRKIIKNGQTILPPTELISIPKNINQNWRGYSEYVFLIELIIQSFTQPSCDVNPAYRFSHNPAPRHPQG